MIYIFILAFIFICFVDGGYLIRKGLMKELVTFIILMVIAAVLGIGKLLNIPTPVELLIKLISPS